MDGVLLGMPIDVLEGIMGMKEVRVCDACGATIVETLVVAKIGDKPEIDLCGKCAGKVEATLERIKNPVKRKPKGE